MMKRIAVLGSTGSIGVNTLKVIRDFPGHFQVTGLSANSNIALLCRQIRDLRPDIAVVRDAAAAAELEARLKGRKVKILVGQQGLRELASHPAVERVVLAISGSAALQPLLGAIDSGKDIALANKEALVMAGSIIAARLAGRKARLIPIDSEQSAIWQCLQGSQHTQLRRIYLTASGGPFRGKSLPALRNVSVGAVLKHPRWQMGRKISVDSATMMNKGLEVLETMFLFGVEAERIKVLVHPEAVIHSMVEFTDGVIMAQLSATDMRIPIQYALSYPLRLGNPALPKLDFVKIQRLNFEEPDSRRFPALRLAYAAAREKGTLPAVLNAANEMAVEAFLMRKIGFTAIWRIVDKVMSRHKNTKQPSLDDILAADDWARSAAARLMTG